VVGLERALNAYVKEAPDTPFDIKTVPLATASMQEQMAKPGKPRMGMYRNYYSFVRLFQTVRFTVFCLFLAKTEAPTSQPTMATSRQEVYAGM
jgi:hypothetical protein